MSARTRANVDYLLMPPAAVEQDSPPSDSSTFRVFVRGESLHVAHLLCRDSALEAALRVNGFTIPMLDDDQDRR